MGKTRDLFKKIRDTKGTCHAKMGKIKGEADIMAVTMDIIGTSKSNLTEI